MSILYVDAIYSKYPRVALTDKNNQLVEIDLEQTSPSSIGNIYSAVVNSIEPSLDAAFVKYDNNPNHRCGFISFREIDIKSLPRYDAEKTDKNAKVSDLIKVGDKLLIQIKKEERDQKGAAVSTYISLAGSYLVALPNSPQSSGVSTRVDSNERQNLREMIDQIKGEDNCGLIIRTAGVGRSLEELKWDYETLMTHWKKIQEAAKQSPAPLLIHQESDPVIRAARDYLTPNIDKIITNESSTYERLKNYISMIRGEEFTERLELDLSPIPLFSRHANISESIARLFERVVPLPSGGEITIEPTEALTAIDVNSKRATQGSDIEQTALETNLEAAEVALREIRLRKLSGIIAIDFIDMNETENRNKVEKLVEKIIKQDRARTRFEPISQLTGVMSLSRQRIGTPIHESHKNRCNHCESTGHALSIEGAGIKILRKIHEYASSSQGQLILVQASVHTANYLLNELRAEIIQTESTYHIKTIITANKNFHTGKFTIKRFRLNENEASPSSYELNSSAPEKIDQIPSWHRSPDSAPAVANRVYKSQSSTSKDKPKKSFWQWIVGSFSSTKAPAKKDNRRGPRSRQGDYKRSNKPRSQDRSNDGNTMQKNRSKNTRGGTRSTTRRHVRSGQNRSKNRDISKEMDV